MFVCHDVSCTARFTSSVYGFKQQQPSSAFVFGMTPSLARLRCVRFGDGKDRDPWFTGQLVHRTTSTQDN